jgi:hypothetical protein
MTLLLLSPTIKALIGPESETLNREAKSFIPQS